MQKVRAVDGEQDLASFDPVADIGEGGDDAVRIFEMVKAVGAASHAEVLGGRKGARPRALLVDGSFAVGAVRQISITRPAR